MVQSGRRVRRRHALYYLVVSLLSRGYIACVAGWLMLAVVLPQADVVTGCTAGPMEPYKAG